jgi:hypothetical protein
MGKILLLILGAMTFAACGQQQPAARSTKGLRKISVTDAETVARIRQSGAKILVQEPDYLVVYSEGEVGISSQPASEQDLVQRVARIHFADQTQLQKIVDLGVDLWEVESDSATARVYDLYLEQLKQDGFAYRILKMDAAKEER